MGKTRRTYRDALQDEKQNWERMRSYLRVQNQPAYDQLWAHAERHQDAAGQANPRDPMVGILLSICLGQQREIRELKATINS